MFRRHCTCQKSQHNSRYAYAPWTSRNISEWKMKKIDIAMMAEPRIIRRAVKMRMSRQKKKQMQPDSQQNPLNGGKRQKAINA